MTEDEDMDGMAAEYVLGSLDAAERKEVEARRRKDPALASTVAEWERRLGPLSGWVPGLEPPAHVLPKIMARISGLQRQRSPQSAEAIQLRGSAVRWRAFAVGTSSLAACVALAIGLFLYLQPEAPTGYVAELHRFAGSPTADEIVRPAFVVTVDLKPCTVSVRPVTARARAGRSYQLWIRPEGKATPSPLTVIGPTETTTLPCPPEYARGDLANAMLAVSIEAEGGSQTGAPVGDFVFVGKLVPTQAPHAGDRPR